MRRLLALVLVVSVIGCSSKPAETAAGAAASNDPFVQKLNSMPESERAAYARAHAAEAMASAGAPPPTTAGN